MWGFPEIRWWAWRSSGPDGRASGSLDPGGDRGRGRPLGPLRSACMSFLCDTTFCAKHGNNQKAENCATPCEFDVCRVVIFQRKSESNEVTQ